MYLYMKIINIYGKIVISEFVSDHLNHKNDMLIKN